MTHSKFEARRAEVRRAITEKRKRIGIAVGGVVMLLGAAYLAVESPFLDVDRIDIRGERRMSEEEIVTAARVRHGQALFHVDPGTVASRLEDLPWIESAHVELSVPGTVRITVQEYDAVAYVPRGNGAIALLAADGHVIDDVQMPPEGAVEVRGVRRVPKVGSLLSPPDAPGIVRELPSALAQQVVAIDVAGEGVALDLERGGEVRLGSLNDLDAKAAAAIAVLERLGTTPFTYVDVRVPQSPVAGGFDTNE